MASFEAPASRPSRPATVTAASYLMYLAAGLLVVGAALQFALLAPATEVYEQQSVEPARPMAYIVVGLTAGIWLVLAGGLLTLGILNGNGKQASRMVTWVVGGLVICCCGYGTISDTVASLVATRGSSETTAGQSPMEVAQAISSTVPVWFHPTNAVVQALVLAAVAIAVVLLSVPASHPHFQRRVIQVWAPIEAYALPPQAPFAPAPQLPPTETATHVPSATPAQTPTEPPTLRPPTPPQP
jgi:hypothetical protein